MNRRFRVNWNSAFNHRLARDRTNRQEINPLTCNRFGQLFRAQNLSEIACRRRRRKRHRINRSIRQCCKRIFLAFRFKNRAVRFRFGDCLLYTSPSPRDRQKSRMPSSA